MSAFYKIADKTLHKKWAVKIQHFSISSKFDMFPTLKTFYRSPFSKWSPQYRTNSTLSDFNDISLWVDYVVPNLFPALNNF
jgi:hypothetical protein